LRHVRLVVTGSPPRSHAVISWGIGADKGVDTSDAGMGRYAWSKQRYAHHGVTAFVRVARDQSNVLGGRRITKKEDDSRVAHAEADSGEPCVVEVVVK